MITASKQILKRAIPWLIALALLIWIWHQIPWGDVGVIFRSISLLGLFVLFALDLIIVAVMSGRWWFVLQGLDIHLDYFQACQYRLAATAVSYFTPGPQFGGEPLQIWVLTHHQNVAGETAIASVTIDKLMELIANFAVLIFGILVILQSQTTAVQSNSVTLYLTIFLWGIPTTLLLSMLHGQTPLSNLFSIIIKSLFYITPFRFKKRAIKLQKAIKNSEIKVHQLRHQAPQQLIAAWSMTCLNWLLWFAEFWLVYALLGVSLNGFELFFALTTARIAFLLPSPTGLGTFEASQYLAMSALGQPVSIGFSAALLMRVRDTLLAGTGIWFARRLIGST